MSKPDDARFRPGDPPPDNYDVGEEYASAPAPGSPAPAPYGALERPVEPRSEQPWGEPPASSSAGPGAPPSTSPYLSRHGKAGYRQPTGSYAPGGFLPARTGGSRRSWRMLLAAGVIVAIVVVALVNVVAARITGDGGTGSGTDPTTPDTPADTTAVWMLESEDLTAAGSETGFARTPGGAFTGDQLIVTEDAWAFAWEEDRVPAGIAAVDPADGTLLWERPVPGVLCADRPIERTLLCLAPGDGTWVYHRIDIATGRDILTAETSLADVQTVYATADALLAVGPASPAPHAQVTGLAHDGTQLWNFDVAEVENADVLFAHFYDSDGDPVLERPRWRDLDGGLVMLWSTPGVAIIDPLTGATHVHTCRSATPQGDHYLCIDDAGLNRHALDGTVTWTNPRAALTVPEERSDPTPVAITEPTANQFEIVPIDWETGEITAAATFRFAQVPGTWTGIVLPPSAYTLGDATVIVGDTEIVGLDPERADLLWSLPIDETYVGDVVQVGDLAVVETGSDLTGIDITTGEVAWVYRNTGDSLAEIDGMLVSVGFRIGVLETP